MTALADSMQPNWFPSSPDGLTVADYEALPEEISRRIEVVDGAVVLSPSPRRVHQFVTFQLAHAMFAAVKGRQAVTIDADLRLRDVPLLVRRPDIVVYDSSIGEETELRPEHCLLAIEVMSPTSMTTDRMDKPAEYAAAGIKHYWRIEDIDAVKQTMTIFRYVLDPTTRRYGLVGTDTGVLSVRDPIDITIELADLY